MTEPGGVIFGVCMALLLALGPTLKEPSLSSVFASWFDSPDRPPAAAAAAAAAAA